MNFLISLPDFLVQRLLVEWTDLAGIARLDSSFCHHLSRVSFLAVAFSTTTVYCHTPECISSANDMRICYYVIWVIRRNVLIDSFSLGLQLIRNQHLWKSLLEITGYKLKSIKMVMSEFFQIPLPSALISSITTKCPNLTSLSLQSCIINAPALFERMLIDCPIISLAFSYGEHSPSLEKYTLIARRCSNLQSLELDDTNVTNSDLQLLLQSCQILQTLTITRCRHIDAGGLDFVAIYGRNLRTLYIWQKQLTDRTILLIARHCTELLNVIFAGRAYTEVSILEIIRRCQKLQKLKILINDQIADFTRNVTEEHCPRRLQVLFIPLHQGL